MTNTTQPYHIDTKFIDAVGGTNKVARMMGAEQNAVSQWRRDGLPAAKRWAFKKKCEELGIELPENFMELK